MIDRVDVGHGRPNFEDVDADEPSRLVGMMDATDRWPAVGAVRDWVLDRAAGAARGPWVDVGCGLGTFSSAARRRGMATVDLDLSATMVDEVRRRSPGAATARADVARLPLVDGAAGLVRCERALQWAGDPASTLAELWRVTAPGGVLAVTDTDWGTFVVDHPDASGADRLSAAGLGWLPHPRLARSLPRRLADLGAVDVEVRTDAVALTGWDPDAADQSEGPPGLPLSAIATGSPEPEAAAADVRSLGEAARRGRFFATLVLVTALGRRPSPRRGPAVGA